ncbi:MAG: hypothetical protein R3348_06730 [Xanthomonadales bacterium]|nr:hypothetical protein [Xanthomonadales bacterium]
MKRILFLSLFLACLGVNTPVLAQQDPQVRKDLETVLTLKGKACDGVSSYEPLGENDYLVNCANGKRYRVRIADDQVIVEDR